VANFHPFAKIILKKEYSVVISPVFWGKKSPKKEKNPLFLLPKFIKIAYNMQGCLRFFFTSISPNLAKYIYEPSALEQHHRIEKKKECFSPMAKH
jgi:hypothetical protein